MASSRSAIQTAINNKLADNCQNEITAQDLRDVINDLLASGLLLTEPQDKKKVITREHVTTRTYYQGELVIKDGQLYQAKQSNSGTFDPNDWEPLGNAQAAASFSEWDTSTVYHQGDVVSHERRIYRSKQDNNQGNEPGQGTTYWEELSYSQSGYRGDWQPAVYTHNQTVTYNGREYAAKVLAQNASSFSSNDFQAELQAGNWALVSPGLLDTQYQGVPHVVPSNASYTVAAGHQWIVYDEMTIDGEMTIAGELIVLPSNKDLTQLRHEPIAYDVIEPANRVYTPLLAVPFDGKIQRIWAKVTSGSLDIRVLLNGSPVAGLTITSVGTSLQKAELSSPVAFSTGDSIAVEVFNNSSAQNLNAQLDLIR
jgi:hypothetical protein